MLQITVSRRHLMVFTAAVAMVISVAWVGVAQRAAAASATPVVYVATGENFPDALGAASAAAVQAGPVLLVQKYSIPAETKAELSRLSPDVIYVAGGTAVVSDAVFNELKGYAPSVVRAAGANRYATAVEVSKSAFPVTGGGSTALEARIAALETKVAQLEATLAGVSRNGNVLQFSGMNLQVVNGLGQTDSKNALGNIIVGYNEKPYSPDRGYRAGSHYLIIGIEHSYSAYGGIVVGHHNTASGKYASVTGDHNTASGSFSSVTGGGYNTASDIWASVTGGVMNVAESDYSSVCGGGYNTASGEASSVSGGRSNTASGHYSSILGGNTRGVSGNYGTYPFCSC